MEISQAIKLATGGIGGHYLFQPPLPVLYVRPRSQGRPVVARLISVATDAYSVIPKRAGKFEIEIAGGTTIWVEPAKIRPVSQST